VLKAAPGNPYALVMQGELYQRDGDDRAAVNWYDRAIESGSRLPGLPADLVQRLQRAAAARATIAARF
jgi:TPR repeat protein